MNKTRWGIALIFIVALALGGLSLVSAQENPTLSATVTAQVVNLRVLPDIPFDAVGALHNGDAVTVIGRQGSNPAGAIMWVQVQTADGVIGWGNTRAFAIDGDVASLAVTVPGGSQGVVAAFATLRARPALEAASVVRLGEGTVVDLVATDRSGEWIFVAAPDGVTGWVFPRALAYMAVTPPTDLFVTDATIAPEQAVATVNLRLEPSAEAATRGFATVGSRVQVMGVSADGDWYYVVPVETRVPAWIYAPLLELDPSVEYLPVVGEAAPAEEAPAEEAPAAEAAPAQ